MKKLNSTDFNVLALFLLISCFLCFYGCGDISESDAPVYDYTSIASGSAHSVAVRTDGTLWAWGRNTSGQLGDGSGSNQDEPVQVGTGTDWEMVAAGANHSLAIKTDGTLWAWGNNTNGQLGDNSTTVRTTPVQIGSDTDWAMISGGGTHSLAIKTGGTLNAWGSNSDGQVGDDSGTQQAEPVQIGSDTDWDMVAAGRNHSMALKTNGELWAWGDNSQGQLGNNSTSDETEPLQIGTDTDWDMVAAGESHTVAIKTDGSLYAWGGNNDGQLGDDNAPTPSNEPIQIGTDTDWDTIMCGYKHTIGLKGDGTLWAWGNNAAGQLGNSDDTYTNVHAPEQIGTDTNWSAIAGGENFTLALKTVRSLWTSGDNSAGQLGDGNSPTDRNTFVRVSISTD